MGLFTTLLWMLGGPTAGAAPHDIHPVELESMVEEIAPVVEQVAGRTFLELPRVVMADEDRLREVIYTERLHLAKAHPQGTAESAEARARSIADAVTDAFAGKYGFLDKTLYISVDTIAYRLAAQDAPKWLLRPMVRVVVAHELAHALQDQHADLGRMVEQARGRDAVLAIDCAVEGHAVWVHEGVASRMGLGEALAVMTDLQGADRALEPMLDPDAYYNSYIYGLGRDFVAFHMHHGGTEQVWEMLRRPPASTAQIATPGRFAHRRSLSWPSPALRKATRKLAPHRWPTHTRRLGDYEVRDQLLRAKGSEVLADAMVDGWSAQSSGGPTESFEIQHLRFDTPTAARAFVAQMSIGANRQAELLRGDPFVQASAGRLDCVSDDVRTARETLAVTLFGDGPKNGSKNKTGPGDQLARLWLSKDEHVLQVVLVNAPNSDRRLCRVLDPLLERLGGVFRE